MTCLETLAECLRNGMTLVRHAADTERLEDLFDTDDADALRRLADIYFGDTTFTGYQRRAIAAATEQRHSIHDLLRIEHHARRLRNSRHMWKLRTHLCGVPGVDIDTAAKTALARFLPAPAPKPLGVKHYRGKTVIPTL